MSEKVVAVVGVNSRKFGWGYTTYPANIEAKKVPEMYHGTIKQVMTQVGRDVSVPTGVAKLTTWFYEGKPVKALTPEGSVDIATWYHWYGGRKVTLVEAW